MPAVAAVNALVPFAFTIPVKVVTPVPPLETPSVPVIFEAATSAIFESVTDKSPSLILVMPPSATPPLAALAAT